MIRLRKIFACLFLMMFVAGFSNIVAADEKLPGETKLVSVKATGYDSVKITWKKAENTLYYWVYYKIDGKWMRVGKTQGTSFEHKSSVKSPLVPGKTYTYTVKAFQSKDVFGKYSKEGMSVKLPVPKLDMVQNIKTSCLDYNRMEITWDKAQGAVLYRVYIRQGDKWVKVGSTKGTSFVHKSSERLPLTIGDYYTYTVRAEATYGGKTFYADFNKKGIKGKVRPQTPALVSVQQSGTNQVTLKWKKCEGASKYVIYYKQTGSSWKKIAEIDANKTEFVHTSSSKYPLKASTTYAYTVRSYSEHGAIHSIRNEIGLPVAFMSSAYLIDQKVHTEAQKVIARVTKPEMSRSQKLNACFSWVMWSHYKPNSNPNYNQENWQYHCAYDYLSTHTGSCHGFAFGFAALARELGYQPYVICIPHVHSIVRIDGGYWDNMHGGLRGVSYSPMSYSESNVFKFY